MTNGRTVLAALLASAAVAPGAAAQSRDSLSRPTVPKAVRETLRPVQGFVAPRTATEQVVASVYSEILASQRVGAADSFSVLGGHSLSATAAAVRLEEKLGVRVEPQLLLCGKNVGEVAAALDASGAKPVAATPRTKP
jgi:acyl carrier protein